MIPECHQLEHKRELVTRVRAETRLQKTIPPVLDLFLILKRRDEVTNKKKVQATGVKPKPVFFFHFQT